MQEIYVAKNTKRKPDKKLGGYWEFPGGKVEQDENPENAVKREIKEELGIEIVVNRYLGDSIYNYEFGDINLKGYRCTFISGEISLTDHSEIMWVNIENLYTYNIAPADISLIKYIED